MLLDLGIDPMITTSLKTITHRTTDLIIKNRIHKLKLFTNSNITMIRNPGLEINHRENIGPNTMTNIIRGRSTGEATQVLPIHHTLTQGVVIVVEAVLLPVGGKTEMLDTLNISLGKLLKTIEYCLRD